MANSYVIYYPNENGNLFLKQKGKILIEDTDHASRWPSEQSAKRVLNSLPNKPLPNETAKLMPNLQTGNLDELVEKENTNVISLLPPNPEVERLMNLDQAEFDQQILSIVNFFLALPELKQRLTSGLSFEDSSVLQDFLHVIELSNFNAVTGYKLAKGLQDSRRKRRLFKDRIKMLNHIQISEDGSISISNNALHAIQTELSEDTKLTYGFRTSRIKKLWGHLINR